MHPINVKRKLVEELLTTQKNLTQADERAEKAKAEAKAAASSKGEEEEESDMDDGDDDDEEDNDPWDLKYIELREYFALNGNFAVPRSGAHSKLSIWIKNQKACYRNVKNNTKGQKITSERINKLEAIGFPFGGKDAAPALLSWEEGVEQWKKYKAAKIEININVNNPTQHAKWVSAQRHEYRRFRKGKHSLLDLEKIAELKEIGFKFKGPRLPHK